MRRAVRARGEEGEGSREPPIRPEMNSFMMRDSGMLGVGEAALCCHVRGTSQQSAMMDGTGRTGPTHSENRATQCAGKFIDLCWKLNKP